MTIRLAGKEPSVKRSITVTAAKGIDDLYFRAAVGNKIEASYSVGGKSWTYILSVARQEKKAGS